MSDFLNLVLPFFATPKTYDEMLKKLAGFAFYETYLITFFLRDIPQIGTAFRSIETYGSIGGILGTIPNANLLNISGLGLALLVALVSHVSQLHDRVSDLLGIRKRFDKNKILIPLAQLVGATLTDAQLKTISDNRDSVMRDVFYRYTSSRAEKPLVDKHDIEHALAAWAWFWVFVEAAVYFALASIAAIAFSAPRMSFWFLIVMAIFVVLALVQHSRLSRRARPEIEAIAQDYTASRDVRAKFDAL